MTALQDDEIARAIVALTAAHDRRLSTAIAAVFVLGVAFGGLAVGALL